jgi:hypothetical protein
MKLFFLFTFILFKGLLLNAQIKLSDTIFAPVHLKQIENYLASDQLKGRLIGSNEASIAAIYIANEFKKAGAKPLAVYHDFLVPFEGEDFYGIKRKGYNVIAAIAGKSKSDEIVMFSAHYDHVGTTSTYLYNGNEQDKTTDSIYNGANDDASGVTAIILLARYFAAVHNNERTLVFCAFSGEEEGLIGSKNLSEDVDPLKIVADINIEMIGRGGIRKIHPYITGGDLSDLKTILDKRLASYNKLKYGSEYFLNDPFSGEKLFERSDNWWFASLGIPAHTIMTTSPTDKYYHSVYDEVNTLNFNMMSEVIKSIALSVEGIVTGTDTPTRITKLYSK